MSNYVIAPGIPDAQWQQAREDVKETFRGRLRERARMVSLVNASALAASFLLSGTLEAGDASSIRTLAHAPGVADSPDFVLEALFVPAMNRHLMPLRWVDPVAALHCGGNSFVRVNGEPLVAGALVPETPFELEWHAEGCRPSQAPQARLDGDVKLTVFREDWGYSAIVKPVELRLASASSETTLIKAGGAWLNACADFSERDEPLSFEGDVCTR